ncbi:MAG: hypothetical protein GF414_00860, partial [Candidatus Altiarchaeales archaeon]|nr:hypothetical protein [Candidatus Altiarchaeales archaeon]
SLEEFENYDDNGVREDIRYIYANGERIAKVYDNGSKVYYLNDHLGSSSVLVDDGGEVVNRITYYPFGEIKIQTGSEKYGYNSKELDDTGLLYYGARYYNPSLKRWTQPDTIIQDKYDPQLLNRYNYVRNNPVIYTDPDGHIIPLLFAALVIGGSTSMYAYSRTPGEHTVQGVAAYGSAGMIGASVAYFAAPAMASEAGVARWTAHSAGKLALANGMGAGVEKGLQNAYDGDDLHNGVAESMVIAGGTGFLGGVSDDFSGVIKSGMYAPTKSLTTKTGLYYTKGVIADEVLQIGVDYSIDKDNWLIDEKDKKKKEESTIDDTNLDSSQKTCSHYYIYNAQSNYQKGNWDYRSIKSSKYAWMVTGTNENN